MGCELLVVVNPKTGLTEIGNVFAIKETPCEWGKKEGPPNWKIVKVSNASKADLQFLLDTEYEAELEWDGGKIRKKMRKNVLITNKSNLTKSQVLSLSING